MLSELAQQLDTGDKSAIALQTFYDLLWLSVECEFAFIKTVRGYRLDLDESEEVASRTYLFLASKALQFSNEIPFDRWVGAIARRCFENLRLENLRSKEISERLMGNPDCFVFRTNDFSSFVVDQIDLEEALTLLTEKERITFGLFRSGLSISEIAESLEEAGSTTRSRFERASRKIRKRLMELPH